MHSKCASVAHIHCANSCKTEFKEAGSAIPELLFFQDVLGSSLDAFPMEYWGDQESSDPFELYCNWVMRKWGREEVWGRFIAKSWSFISTLLQQWGPQQVEIPSPSAAGVLSWVLSWTKHPALGVNFPHNAFTLP